MFKLMELPARESRQLFFKIGQWHMNGEKPYVTVVGKGSKIRSMYQQQLQPNGLQLLLQ